MQSLKEYTVLNENVSYTIPITSKEKKHFDIAVELNNSIRKRFPKVNITLVGGSCRDLFYRKFFGEEVQKNINDLDFSIFNSNDTGLNEKELTNVMNYIKSLGEYNVIDELDHLHLKILTKADNYEIEYTSTRKEAYQDTSRKPDTVVGSIIDDIIRRDFTINAIYLVIDEVNSDNIIVTPYNNESKQHIDHVRKKLLKTTTDNPDTVFKDDPLRIMRAIRFSGYGYDMDDSISNSIDKFPKEEMYKKVSYERISDELGKILKKGDVEYLIKSGFIKKLIQDFGEFDDKTYKDYELQHIVDVVKKARELAPENEKLTFLLAGLLHDVGKGGKRYEKDESGKKYNKTDKDIGEWSDKKNRWTFNSHDVASAEIAYKFMKEFKFPNKLINDVTNIIQLHMESKSLLKLPTTALIRWILKYDNQQKYPNLIDNVLLFNDIDWGGKSEEWRENNKNLMISDEIKDKAFKLRGIVRDIKINHKDELKAISIKIGRDKSIPSNSKSKAIAKAQSKFIEKNIKNGATNDTV